jgi:hypothetical protein
MNKGARLMKTVRALELMQDSFNSMMRSGLLEDEVEVSPETVLLGVGSSPDSLGFITFFSDLEERISADSSQEHYLVLTEIHEFNTEQAFLSAGALAQYIEKITG